IPCRSGLAWVGSTHLGVDFPGAPAIRGPYTMVLNPTILSTGGIQLDQNNNGTPGEIPGDRYTASYDTRQAVVGGNAFGYVKVDQAYDASFNIQPGDPGVSVLTGVNGDDVSDT